MTLIANLKPVEAEAFATYGLTGSLLMQTAGCQLAKSIARELHARGLNQLPGIILCGTGNNGGDGLVCAEQLDKMGVQPIYIALTKSPETMVYKSDAALKAFLSLRQKNPDMFLDASQDWTATQKTLSTSSWLVDALFGYGLNRPLKGIEIKLVEAINTRRHKPLAHRLAKTQNWPPEFNTNRPTDPHGEPFVISVDAPSGIDCLTGQVWGNAIQADITYALACAKPGLYLQPGKAFAGTTQVLDIGIPPVLLEKEKPQYHLLTQTQVHSLLPSKWIDGHKYNNGHLLIIAGSEAMPGAAVLACRAALQSGVGLITIAAPQNVFRQESFPAEVIRLHLPDKKVITSDSLEALIDSFTPSPNKAHVKVDAILLGPGLGKHPETVTAIQKLLVCLNPLPCAKIIDADALNHLATSPITLDNMWVLTPHTGECARLLSCSSLQVASNLLLSAEAARDRYNATIVLKSASTVIAEASAMQDGQKLEPLWISPAGHFGMAKAGTGDVLSGLIAGLSAQHTTLRQPVASSAKTGVYWHGCAGELAVEQYTPYSTHASHIIEMLPKTLKRILRECH